MSSPVFALCLSCLFLMKTAAVTDIKLSQYTHQDSAFVTLQAGEKLKLSCLFEAEYSVMLYWYKQPLGQRTRLISSYDKYGNVFSDELKNNSRFTLDTEKGKNHLTISDLHTSDSATYYCISVFATELQFFQGITIIVEGSGSNIPTLLHQSASETIQPGGSVTLNCTVHTGTCDGEHSVYWFKNSAESQPGLIYTHGGSNHQCERKPNTQTHTCVYNLAMKSLSVSHAGIYYCAVASCGHILFGNGTKLDVDNSTDEVNTLVLLYMLSGALTFVTLLVVLLSLSLYKMKKTNSCQSTESQARFLTSSATNTEGYREEHDPHYAALGVNLPNRSRRQRNDFENECVYSSVKQ